MECLGSHERAEWQVGPTGVSLPASVSPSSRSYTQQFSSVNRLEEPDSTDPDPGQLGKAGRDGGPSLRNEES